VAVPLSYSLPAFRPDGWDAAAEWLHAVRGLGFSWVTLHPAYAVADTDPPHIETSNVPPVAPVVAEARRLGLRVRIEPHLDFESTLRGEYEWRRRMLVDPSAEYFQLVLRPLAALLPDEMTLGSELDVSVVRYTREWREVAAELRPLGIALGHKLNHDWDAAAAFMDRWQVRRYLRLLDYRAVSFYTAEPWSLAGQWVIGEFGLGSTDIARPWYFGADRRFLTELDFAVRREWYLRFFEWLKGREGRAASFWTVGQFDVLGVMDSRWRDDAVVDAVRAYNAAAAQASP
jgi:hypothetical protein